MSRPPIRILDFHDYRPNGFPGVVKAFHGELDAKVDVVDRASPVSRLAEIIEESLGLGDNSSEPKAPNRLTHAAREGVARGCRFRVCLSH